MACNNCGADYSALKVNGKVVCPACYLKWLEQQPGRSQADLHQRIAELEAQVELMRPICEFHAIRMGDIEVQADSDSELPNCPYCKQPVRGDQEQCYSITYDAKVHYNCMGSTAEYRSDGSHEV